MREISYTDIYGKSRIIWRFFMKKFLSVIILSGLVMAAPIQAEIKKSTFQAALIKAAQKADQVTDVLMPWVILLGTSYVGYYNWTTPANWVDYCSVAGKCVLINENPLKSYFTPIMAVSLTRIIKNAVKQACGAEAA